LDKVQVVQVAHLEKAFMATRTQVALEVADLENSTEAEQVIQVQ
jgi:hypothetical protein|tara:strand:- start:131 stop:262 length:132 start_codon:yes stop_codon:yes gene_type:complete